MIERADLLGGTCEAGPEPRPRLDRDRRAAPDRVGRVSIRVIVADDQEIVRTGLTMILNAQPDIEVIGEAADGQRAVELARRLRPDVCLFDIRMPGLDGIEATRALAGPAVADPLAVVVITTFDLDEYVYAALRAGARGFLLKDAGAGPARPGRPRRRQRRRADRPEHHRPAAPGLRRRRARRDRPRSRSSRSPTGRSRCSPPWHADGPTARSPTSCTSPSARSRPTSPA